LGEEFGFHASAADDRYSSFDAGKFVGVKQVGRRGYRTARFDD
jgi:hypothetical protein